MKLFGYLDDAITEISQLPEPVKYIMLGMIIVLGILVWYKLVWRD